MWPQTIPQDMLAEAPPHQFTTHLHLVRALPTIMWAHAFHIHHSAAGVRTIHFVKQMDVLRPGRKGEGYSRKAAHGVESEVPMVHNSARRQERATCVREASVHGTRPMTRLVFWRGHVAFTTSPRVVSALALLFSQQGRVVFPTCPRF